jgi:hypothetical protein
MVIIMLAAASYGCGKKGDPTLRSYDKPDAPSSVSALHREDGMIINWKYPGSKENLISEFVVLRSSGSGFGSIAVIPNDQRTFTDREINRGSTYEYKILSRSIKGISSRDSDSIKVSPSELPPKPMNAGFSVSGNTVILHWDAKDPAGLFNIYKSAAKGSYGMKPINLLPVSGGKFTDLLSLNRTSHYTVRGLKGGNLKEEGLPSDEITVDPSELVPPKPERLDAYAAKDRVVLSWKEIEESWITGYRIYRRYPGEEFKLVGSSQVPTFSDNDAPVSKRDYRVTAVGPVKEGPATELHGIVHIPQR